MVSTLEQMQVPNGTGPGVRMSKRPLKISLTGYGYVNPYGVQIAGHIDIEFNLSFVR